VGPGSWLDVTQVLISGGSAVGMSTALFLAHQGVSCVVIDKKPGPTGHPGFRGISARTMELFRTVGVEDDIHAVVGEQHRSGFVARARNLSDPDVKWFENVPWTPDFAAVSPSVFVTCDQDVLEPVLGDKARALGVDVRFSTELVSFTQDADGVHAVLGDGEVVHADYLVAADGTRSPVREWLGIDRDGDGVLEHRLNVLFDTDLEPTLQGKRLTACMCTDINGALVPRSTRPWLMSVPYEGDVDNYDADVLLDLIRKGVGHNDFTATILEVFPWRPTALMAARYRVGRVFLTGDAANVMPPTGGFGGNTGIQSAYNLAWKLAAVLSGRADDALLDTYETERVPVDRGTVEEALVRLRSWYKAPEDRAKGPAPLPDNTVMFGYRYGPDLFEDPREAVSRPGSRAPHIKLKRDGTELSSIDLFGRGFVLLTSPTAHRWHQAGQVLTDAGDLEAAHQIGDDVLDIEDAWPQRYGVAAVLVRPDGFVTWQTTDDPEGDPVETLRDVLNEVLRPRATVTA
jgi:putative polyketide hydroxylase